MAIGLVYTGASSRCELCDRERFSCFTSAGTTAGWIKSALDDRRRLDFSSFRCKIPYSGSMQSYWPLTTQELSVSKVRVAADYSDSVPDSPKYHRDNGYHPLEELKEREKKKNMVLTDAEIARTTVEANNKALLIFPGGVHKEPHWHVSWAEFQYVIDDYGDIFFEIFDDENILQDRGANSPVTVLIGSDCPIYGENSTISGIFDMDGEIGDTGVTDTLIEWGMPDTLHYIHPLYFAKCLTKVVHTKHRKKDGLSNGLEIVGCLRPAFIDEESYLRGLFYRDGDGYMSDWSDESEKEEEEVAGTYNLIDGGTGMLSFNSKHDRSTIRSTFYKLEILTMELCSAYGDQSIITRQAFQESEPDLLAHSASAIVERINEYGLQWNVALKTLCRRKKGLNVEGANLIGVDSLGIDVRVYCGPEARTLRFPFNDRAMTEIAAEKKIKRLLFPRYRRKNNLRPATDGIREL